MKLKFGKYYTNKWQHDLSLGVGLKFTGKPTDLDAFIELLQGENCNPVATRRILDDLMQEGIRYTTVMSHLDFEYIGDELAKLNVIMEIIEPKIPSFDTEVDTNALLLIQNEQPMLAGMSEEAKQEVYNRYHKAKEHFNKYNQNLGPYDPNFNFE